MTWGKIIGEIDKIKQIVENWQETGEIHAIEKEIALDKLRLIYEEVKFAGSHCKQAVQEAVVKPAVTCVETTPVLVAKEQSLEADAVNIADTTFKARHDRKKLMSLYGDGSDLVDAPHGNMAGAEPHHNILVGRREPMGSSIVPEGGLFVSEPAGQAVRGESGVDILEAMGLESEPVRVASREEVRAQEPVVAVQGEEEQGTVTTDGFRVQAEFGQAPSVKSVAENTLPRTEKNNGQAPYNKVLGETIKTGETFADVYARNNKREDVAEHINNANVSSIRGAIGINDRFLLIRDLFGGNANACDKTIKELDAFADLDDALLYIHDNFSWNPESDGAKLMVDLLTRKLS